MSFLDAFLCGMFGGLFGGVSVFAANIGSAGGALIFDGDRLSRRSLFALLACYSVVGVSGGFVSFLVLILIHKFPGAEGAQDLILLTSVAMVGGFGARRFLPMFVLNIEDTLRKLISETSRTSQELSAVTEKFETKQHLAAITAMAFQQDSDPDRVSLFVAQCEAYTAAHPADADGYVTLARLYRRQGRIEEAIAKLTEYINRNQAIAAPNLSFCTALYNRACYHSLMFGRTKDPSFRDKAIADLGLSQHYSTHLASDRVFTRNDEDFAEIREEAAFKRLVAEP
jgi:tetratricopeptide (TPR) repeat protein